MSDKTYVLSLSADTFNAFKMDFDSALQRLLQKMDRLQSDSASINCKISVALRSAPKSRSRTKLPATSPATASWCGMRS